jgi:hypothetical protein
LRDLPFGDLLVVGVDLSRPEGIVAVLRLVGPVRLRAIIPRKIHIGLVKPHPVIPRSVQPVVHAHLLERPGFWLLSIDPLFGHVRAWRRELLGLLGRVESGGLVLPVEDIEAGCELPAADERALEEPRLVAEGLVDPGPLGDRRVGPVVLVLRGSVPIGLCVLLFGLGPLLALALLDRGIDPGALCERGVELRLAIGELDFPGFDSSLADLVVARKEPNVGRAQRHLGRVRPLAVDESPV